MIENSLTCKSELDLSNLLVSDIYVDETPIEIDKTPHL